VRKTTITVFCSCVQIKLMPMGIDNLVLLTDETRKRVYDAARRPPEGFALDKADKEKDKEVTSPTIAAKGKRWGVGCTEFEALMRMLDNAVSATLESDYIATVEGSYVN